MMILRFTDSHSFSGQLLFQVCAGGTFASQRKIETATRWPQSSFATSVIGCLLFYHACLSLEWQAHSLFLFVLWLRALGLSCRRQSGPMQAWPQSSCAEYRTCTHNTNTQTNAFLYKTHARRDNKRCRFTQTDIVEIAIPVTFCVNSFIV